MEVRHSQGILRTVAKFHFRTWVEIIVLIFDVKDFPLLRDSPGMHRAV